MPARKLNPEQIEELHQGDIELMANKVITRLDDDGNELTITTIEQLAAWKGIKPARYHELKRNGWKLLRGVAAPESGEMVPLAAWNALYESSSEKIVKLELKLAQCESTIVSMRKQIAELNRELKAVSP